MELDHHSLQLIESSLSLIVCVWRALSQSFNFKIKHIPAERENRVADWLSLPAVIPNLETGAQTWETPNLGAVSQIRNNPPTTPLSPTIDTTTPHSLDSILQEVNGGHSFYYGAALTWRREQLYPDVTIKILMTLAKSPFQSNCLWRLECVWWLLSNL